MTRWPAGTLLAGLAAWFLPPMLGRDRESAEALERIEATVGWTEQLRDTLAAAGLEQAILATAPIAPVPVRDQVSELAASIGRGQQLPAALRSFTAAAADPAADLMVAALLLATEQQARDLGALLSSLAYSARQHAAIRMRIAASRARIRTAARIIITATLALTAGLLAWSRAFPASLRHRGRAAHAHRGRRLLRRSVLAAAQDLQLRRTAAHPHPARRGEGNSPVPGALLAGAGLGLGLLAIAVGLAPRKVSLADALADTSREPRAPLVSLDPGGWAARVGRPAAGLLGALGLPGQAIRRHVDAVELCLRGDGVRQRQPAPARRPASRSGASPAGREGGAGRGPGIVFRQIVARSVSRLLKLCTGRSPGDVGSDLLADGPPPRDLLVDKGFNGKAFAAGQASRGTAVLLLPAKGQRHRMPRSCERSSPNGATGSRPSSRRSPTRWN